MRRPHDLRGSLEFALHIMKPVTSDDHPVGEDSEKALDAAAVDLQCQLDCSHLRSGPFGHRDLPVPERRPADGRYALEIALHFIDDEVPDRVSHGQRLGAGPRLPKTVCAPSSACTFEDGPSGSPRNARTRAWSGNWRRVLEDESTCMFEDGRLFHVLNTLQLRDNAGESAAAPKHGFESRWGHHRMSSRPRSRRGTRAALFAGRSRTRAGARARGVESRRAVGPARGLTLKQK